MIVVAPVDRPRSVRNRCEVERFFVVSLCYFDFALFVVVIHAESHNTTVKYESNP